MNAPICNACGEVGATGRLLCAQCESEFVSENDHLLSENDRLTGEVDALSRRLAEAERVLAKAMLPLEVLHNTGSFRHPRLRRWYNKLLTPWLRNEIELAVTETRSYAKGSP